MRSLPTCRRIRRGLTPDPAAVAQPLHLELFGWKLNEDHALALSPHDATPAKGRIERLIMDATRWPTGRRPLGVPPPAAPGHLQSVRPGRKPAKSRFSVVPGSPLIWNGMPDGLLDWAPAVAACWHLPGLACKAWEPNWEPTAAGSGPLPAASG